MRAPFLNSVIACCQSNRSCVGSVQAFCGPLISCAMGIMAVAELTRFAISRVTQFMNNDSQNATQMVDLNLPSRLREFSAASLLLSIGVPLLKHQHPELHVCKITSVPPYCLLGLCPTTIVGCVPASIFEAVESQLSCY